MTPPQGLGDRIFHTLARMGSSVVYNATIFAEDVLEVGVCPSYLFAALSRSVKMIVVEFSNTILASCCMEKLKSAVKFDLEPPSRHKMEPSPRDIL